MNRSGAHAILGEHTRCRGRQIADDKSKVAAVRIGTQAGVNARVAKAAREMPAGHRGSLRSLRLIRGSMPPPIVPGLGDLQCSLPGRNPGLVAAFARMRALAPPAFLRMRLQSK